MFGKTPNPGSGNYKGYIAGAAAISVLGFLSYKAYKGYYKVTPSGLEPVPGATAVADESKASNGGQVRPHAFGAGPAHASAKGATADGKGSEVAPLAADSNADKDKLTDFYRAAATGSSSSSSSSNKGASPRP
jgi:hypothetical protein